MRPNTVLGPAALMLVPAHDVHHQRGDQGARKQVRGQHGEDDRLGQGHEQELGHPGQEEHGHEHDADAQGGNEGGHGDLLRAVENRLLQFLALGEVALDVLDLHRGVVHQNADRQRQSAQGHDVDGLAAARPSRMTETQIDSGIEMAMISVRPPVAQEQQDHQRGQARGDQRLAAPRR